LLYSKLKFFLDCDAFKALEDPLRLKMLNGLNVFLEQQILKEEEEGLSAFTVTESMLFILNYL